MKASKVILPLIVISQFCGTSVWFAGNAIVNDLIQDYQLAADLLPSITSSIQFGFIIGTLLFALLAISDRFSPSKVFFGSAILSSLCNACILFPSQTEISILIFRFLTGVFLAGIYPVGMKIAADYYEKGLGKSLGYLVGALVLGTSFPHLINSFQADLSLNTVIISTSMLSIFGGLLILLFVPDGPYRKPSQKFSFGVIFNVFDNRKFRNSALGYFGHMWELYTFWAFVPYLVSLKFEEHVSMYSFSIIAIGGLSCVIGGYLSFSYGAKKVATRALVLSLFCCLISPFIIQYLSDVFFIGFLLFWGMVVIMDSPLFSTMVANNAAPEVKGTAITIVNSIGFFVTILSISAFSYLKLYFSTDYIFMILGVGPIIGIIAQLKKDK